MVSRERTDEKKSYRWCMVPSCRSTSLSTPDKYFVSVPKAKKTRQAWLRAVKRDALDKMPSAKSTMYCCEDHFNMEEDMENFMRVKMVGGYLKVKANVVPHIFKKHNFPKNLSNGLDQKTLENCSKKYCIVEFEKTGDIAAVPHIWIKHMSDNSLCLWPTKSVLFAIKSCKEPNLTSWSSHRVKVLHSFDTYEEARKAEQDASLDLNFHSEVENELGRGKRKKIQKRLSCSDDDSDHDIPTLKHRTPKKRVNNNAGVEHETSTKAAEFAAKANTKVIPSHGDEITIQESSTERNGKEKTPEVLNTEGVLQEKNSAEANAEETCAEETSTESNSKETCAEETSTESNAKETCAEETSTESNAKETCAEKTGTEKTNVMETCAEETSTESNAKETCAEKTGTEKTNVMETTQSKENDNPVLEDSFVESRIENFLDEIHEDSIVEHAENGGSNFENGSDQIQITSKSKDQTYENSPLEHSREETHACCSCKDMLAKVIQELKAFRNEFNNFAIQMKSSNEFRRPTVASHIMIGDGLNFEFPLKSFFELNALEKHISNCPGKKEKLVENMILIGGVNANDAVKRILKGLFSDDLAQIVSWEGRNGKHQLKGLHVIDNLFVAIQNIFGENSPDTAAQNIKYRIREWLKLACSRQLTRKKKQKKNSVSLLSPLENSTYLGDDEINDFHVYAETSNSSINNGEGRSRFENKGSYYEPRFVISDVQSQRCSDEIEIIEPVIKIENI